MKKRLANGMTYVVYDNGVRVWEADGDYFMTMSFWGFESYFGVKPIKEDIAFTDAQLKIIIHNGRLEKAINHETTHKQDATHFDYLIPVYGAGQNRSAQAMENKGWGYICSKAPHDNMFFRPRAEVYHAAREHYKSLPCYARP